MIKSMTGFGRSELKTKMGFIRVEIKTINHKYLEFSTRLPYHLSEYEDTVRKMINHELRRGKVSVYVGCPDPASVASRLVLNEELAKEVFQQIKNLRKVLGFKAIGESGQENAILRDVLRYPDVLTKDNSGSRSEGQFKDVEKAVNLAIKNLSASRLAEGRSLEKDFSGRVVELAKAIGTIEKRIPALHKEYKKSLENRMTEFLKEEQLDTERLTLEVAQYVKNSDISEEVTRFKTHITAMKKTLQESGELGRKIDFIAQEMYRESNTMGAKSSDVTIANAVITLKSAIEKIREQAQNIE